jgi:hypothetical protein
MMNDDLENLKCPNYDCPELLDENIVRELFDEETTTYQRYADYLERTRQSQTNNDKSPNSSAFKCQNLSCLQWLPTPNTISNSLITCYHCQTRVCSECRYILVRTEHSCDP